MTTEVTQPSSHREVSSGLLIGIIMAPLLCSWLLLEKGYSRKARILGFGWLILFMTIILAMPRAHAPVAHPSKPQPVADKPQAADHRSLDTAAPATPTTEAPVTEFKHLFEELQTFKRDPEFLKVGFDPCCRFHRWQQEVIQLDRRDGLALMQQYRVTPNDLQTLASQYLFHGKENNGLAADLDRRLRFALYPPEPAKGRGTVVEETYGCRSFDKIAQYFRLSEEGDYSGSEATLRGPGCEKVAIGTRTGPVLERRAYQTVNGGQLDQLRVRLPNGHEVWLDEGELEFD